MTLCSYCMMESQSKEISKFADMIKNLNTAITSLTETIISLQSSVTNQSKSTESILNPVMETIDDRSMNIVMYGIDESPPTTPKSDRTRNDLNSFFQILSAVDSSIQNASINDLYWLGRFDPSQDQNSLMLLLSYKTEIKLKAYCCQSLHVKG